MKTYHTSVNKFDIVEKLTTGEGYSKLYSIDEITYSIRHGLYLTTSFYQDRGSIESHNPFFIFQNEELRNNLYPNRDKTFVGCLYNSNNTLEENIVCAATYNISDNIIFMNKDHEYTSSKGGNWLDNHWNEFQQFKELGYQETLKRIYELSNNREFIRKTFDIILAIKYAANECDRKYKFGEAGIPIDFTLYDVFDEEYNEFMNELVETCIE